MREPDIAETIAKPSGGLLGGWISRTDLAQQLGVSEDTLRRWDALRSQQAPNTLRPRGIDAASSS